MPKDTFFNLPENKKERILDAALDEFAEHSYHKASVNRIVKKADIAKGSFYQYFEDKKDLFKYIIEKSGDEKLKYLGNVMTNFNTMDFFDVVREMYIAGIKFGKENPKLYKIAMDFMKNTDSKLKEEIMGSNIPRSDKFFEGLLKMGIEKGDITPNIDIGLVAHMITSLSISISEYFIKEVKYEDEMEIITLIDQMLFVIKNGIKNKEGGK